MVDTRDEIRDTKELTPAMRKWRRLLMKGYTIRPRWRTGADGYPVQRPALFNPENKFVQGVRIDTAIRLQELGILGHDGCIVMEVNDGDREGSDVGGLPERGAG